MLQPAGDDSPDSGRIKRKQMAGQFFGFCPAAGDIHFVDQGDNARAGGAAFDQLPHQAGDYLFRDRAPDGKIEKAGAMAERKTMLRHLFFYCTQFGGEELKAERVFPVRLRSGKNVTGTWPGGVV